MVGIPQASTKEIDMQNLTFATTVALACGLALGGCGLTSAVKPAVTTPAYYHVIGWWGASGCREHLSKAAADAQRRYDQKYSPDKILTIKRCNAKDASLH